MVAASPFAANALAFGAVVGVASRQVGQSSMELFLSAFAVNAATSQLAAFEYWRGTLSLGSALLVTALLNAKHLLYAASLWPQIRVRNFRQLSLIGFAITDSSWICCQLAAQRGKLTPEFAIANSWALLSVWVLGCAAGFHLGTVIRPDHFHAIGLSVIAIVSIAALVPKALKGSRHLLFPGMVAAACATILTALKMGVGLSILLASMIGATAAAFRHVE